jgi:uncharacterized membrane protein
VAALGFGLVTFLLAWFRNYTFRSHTFDLGSYDQALWLMAHGHAPFATDIGVNIFRAHVAPVLLLFVPLYALVSTPVWLLFFQSAALATGLLTLVPMLEQLGVSKRHRIGLMLAYMITPALWSAALFDFHVSTLAVPLLFAGITAALRDDTRPLALLGLATLLVRDALGPAVVALMLVGFGASGHKRIRLSIALGALVWFAITGHFGQHVSSSEMWRAHYGYLGSSSADAIQHLGRTIARGAREIFSSGNLDTVIVWLIAFGFLPLLSPRRAVLGAFWVLPMFASANLSRGLLPFFNYYYGAPVLPFLFLATGTALNRLRHRFIDFAGPAVLVACSVATLWSVNPFNVWLGDPAPSRSLAEEALRFIRPSDRVTATPTLGPHLSHRKVLLPFPYPFVPGDDPIPLDASVTRVGPRFVANIDAVAVFLGASGSSPRIRQAFLLSPLLRDFRLVFHEGGLLVYRRDRPSSGP